MGRAGSRLGIEVLAERALARFAPDGELILQIYGSSF